MDDATGRTLVLDDAPVPLSAGLTVRLTFGPLLPSYGSHATDSVLARNAIALATYGKPYTGPSSPWWYSPRDLHLLMAQVSPADTTVRRLCLELGFKLADDRPARSIGREDAAAILERLREGTKPVPSKRLGPVGHAVYEDDGRCYARAIGYKPKRGAQIPFVVEACAKCSQAEKRGAANVRVLLLNRTPSVANILGASYPGTLVIQGCGLHRHVRASTGNTQSPSASSHRISSWRPTARNRRLPHLARRSPMPCAAPVRRRIT